MKKLMLLAMTMCLVGFADESVIKVDKEKREVRVAAEVNKREPIKGVIWPIEIFLCLKGGKSHEAVFRTEAVPSEVHKALVTIGLKPGAPTGEDENGKVTEARGDRVDIFVEWTDPAGARHREPSYKMLVYGSGVSDPTKGGGYGELKECPPLVWLFTGSLTGMNPDTNKEEYGADIEKNIAVVNHQNPSAVFETNQKDKEGFIYEVSAALPPAGIKVSIVFALAK